MNKALKRTLSILLAALITLGVSIAASAAADPRAILASGGSFEAAFKNYSGEWAGGGMSPIKMRLQGDTLTFDYSPVFYFANAFAQGLLTEAEIAGIMDQCVAGFKRWEGVYQVYGRELTLTVDVHPGRTNNSLSASVKVLPKTILGFSGGDVMTLSGIMWKPYNPLPKMYLHTDYPKDIDFETLAMHEFGHVLGLFDAYGYGKILTAVGMDSLSWLGDWLLPEAPLERASSDAVMRGGGRDYISPTDIAMILWGCRNSRLQLYTESIATWLGAEISQAFFD